MKKPDLRHLAVVFLIAACSIATFASSSFVQYPDGYRSWQHVKSMIIQPGHVLEVPFGGIHHVYANKKAMNGLSDGQYKPGAVFVFDLLDYTESGHTVVESDRKRLDVMQYDPDAFADTGDWGYASFAGIDMKERVDQDVATACYACHTAAASSGYVYSQYRP